ncbi:MAG TPA: hypothetical protein VFA99_04615 [Acidobacteriaceae bacterium]|nr:hypothetical protein [Acidobacteriaceae bacterium]
MHDLAIDIVPTTLKPVGFKTGAGFTHGTSIRVGADDEDDEESDD